MVLVLVGALGSDIKVLKVDLKKVSDKNELLDEVVVMMQKTFLMDSKSTVCLVLSKEKIMSSLFQYLRASPS